MINKKYLKYECELVGVTIEQVQDLERKKEIENFLKEKEISSGVFYDDSTNLILIGTIIAETKTEVQCKYKILKEECKRFFNIKKTKDTYIEEGYIS